MSVDDEDAMLGSVSNVVDALCNRNLSIVLQTVTPSKARRQAEADRRREVKEQRKLQMNALEGKRGGLEKQKVRIDIPRP